MVVKFSLFFKHKPSKYTGNRLIQVENFYFFPKKKRLTRLAKALL